MDHDTTTLAGLVQQGLLGPTQHVYSAERHLAVRRQRWHTELGRFERAAALHQRMLRQRIPGPIDDSVVVVVLAEEPLAAVLAGTVILPALASFFGWFVLLPRGIVATQAAGNALVNTLHALPQGDPRRLVDVYAAEGTYLMVPRWPSLAQI